MPDLDELFRTSIELETSPPAEPDAAAVTEADDAPAADDVRAAADAPAADDDDLLVDVRALVTQWNAEHEVPTAVDEAEPSGGARDPGEGTVVVPAADEGIDADEVIDAARPSRLVAARIVLAERIGSHPGNPVEVPHPDDDFGVDSAGTADAVSGAAAPDLTEALAGIQTTRDRRRAQREIDRLQRECARRPLELPDESEVTLVGRAHASPADLHAEPQIETADIEPAEEPADGALVPSTRRARRREWRSTERQRRSDARHQVRYPILTRSVALWLFIFMVAGLVFGASAAFWWSQFNAEVDGIRAETSEFTDEVAGAAGALEAQRTAALNEIDAAMEPLARLAQPGLAPAMAADVAESVFFVETLDEAGAASVGSAFVVANTDTQSLLLTSLSTVASSTTSPGPTITLRQGDRELATELWSWDADLDLALLVVDDPELPALGWAADEAAAEAVGSGIFAVGGLGGAGATAIPGLVVDQSADGFQHTAVIGSAYRGGPILTNDGKVLGVASLDYQPLGFDPGDVHFSVPIPAACGTVLSCGTGGPTDAGVEGGEPLVDPEAEATPT